MKIVQLSAATVLVALLAWFVVIPEFMQGTAIWCEYIEMHDKADWSASDTAT